MNVATALTPRRRTLVLKVRWISGFLLAGVLFVVIATVAAGVVQLITGLQVPVMLDVAREANLPTWYNSVLLLLAGALAAVVGRVEKAARGPHLLHWWGLALAMTLFSIDEMLTFHEWGDDLVPDWMTEPLGTWIHVHPWVLLGLPFVVLFGIAYLPFLRDLPARTRGWIVGAGLIYVLGAVGGESLHGVIHTYYGGGVLTSLANLFEETLEMAGIVIFIHGLLSHLTSPDSGFNLRIEA